MGSAGANKNRRSSAGEDQHEQLPPPHDGAAAASSHDPSGKDEPNKGLFSLFKTKYRERRNKSPSAEQRGGSLSPPNALAARGKSFELQREAGGGGGDEEKA